MFSSKLLTIFLLFTFLCVSSCRFWQNSSNSNSQIQSNNTPEIISEIPFATQEPENFQAQIVVSGETESKTLVTKSGSKRRYDYAFGEKNQVSVLQLEPNKQVVICQNKKLYAESSKYENGFATTSENWTDFLTTEWLNQKTEAKFENLGDENGLTKYRVSFDASETLIFVNENFKIPVKQEFYSIEGEERILRLAVEWQNLKLQADETLFEIPKDFRKVSMAELQNTLRSSGFAEE